MASQAFTPRFPQRLEPSRIVGELHRVADMLPPPDRLVPRDDTVKVTLALSRRLVAFFKREAAKQDGRCQRMIRALVDEDMRRMR